MGNCKTCSKAIFDSLWGEYKCPERNITMYKLRDEKDCAFYVKGTPKDSKENEEVEYGR